MNDGYIFWCNTLSVIATTLIYLFIFLRARDARWCFSYLALFNLWALVSTYTNDLGGYNFELRMYTEPSLSSSYLASLYSIFAVFFTLSFPLFEKVLEKSLSAPQFRFPSDQLTSLAISILIMILLAYAVIDNAQNISAVFTGTLSRGENVGAVSGFFGAYPFVVPTILSFAVYHKYKVIRLLSIVSFMLYLLNIILIGVKFSGLVEALFFYGVPAYVLSTGAVGRKITIRETVALIFNSRSVVFFTVIGCLIYAYYSEVGLGDYILILELIFERVFVFQGQLFWFAFYDVSDAAGWFYSQRSVEYSSLMGSLGANETGMNFLMRQILGPEADLFFEKGFMYAMGFPAILLYIFPAYVNYLVMAFFGVVFAIICSMWLGGVKKRSIILTMIAASMSSPLLSVMFTGNFNVFFTLLLAIKFMLYFIVAGFGIHRRA